MLLTSNSSLASFKELSAGRSKRTAIASHQQVVRRRFAATPAVGDGYFEEASYEGVQLGYGNFRLHKQTQLELTRLEEVIEMRFTLSGHTQTHNLDVSEAIDFGPDEHNLLYTAKDKVQVSFKEADQHRFLLVRLTPSYFMRYFPKQQGVFARFAEAIQTKKSALLHPHHLPVTSIMAATIAELIKPQTAVALDRVRTEAKVLELLLLQLDQMLAHNCEHFCSLRQEDVDRMHTIRELLLQNMNESYTIERLAKHVGTNAFTLKKGFKEMFGTTIFTFRKNQQMKHARGLLLGGQCSVAEVSELVGYKQPHHFSSAFKKHYGLLPSQLSRN